ncbi:MAG: exonuclease SbcC [Methanohalophilus sp. T328-1]|nr:MAG: exonuclease SbcC [Methanohalophilus sp. T328-1]
MLEDEIGKLLENAQSMGFDRRKLDNLEELEDLLLNKQRHLHGKEKEVRTRLDQLSKTLTEHRNLLEKGACPTCGQDLQGSTIVNDTKEEELQKKELEEQLEKLIQDTQRTEEKIATLKEAGKIKKQVDEKRQRQLLINQKQENLASYNEELKKQNQEDGKKKQKLSERIGELEKDIKRAEDEIKEIQQTAKTATEHHKKMKENLESAKYLMKIRQDHTQMQSDHQHLKTGIQENVRFIDEQIAEKKRNKKQLENELGKENIEELEKKLHEFQQAYQKIIGDIEEKNKQKTDLLKEIGQIETNLKRKKALQEKLKVFNNREKYLKAVRSDVENLEDMYMRLRADLRTRNIDALDRLLNEIFSFMYTNNAYSHIQLDTDYELTIYEKDGTPLEPKLLSGGERAIFNLVLRCAIYRLLSEGLAGGEYRNEMPPLIMDEPTVFLDRGHVHQLLKLIDLMRDMGVGQILIVSHDETLIDSADNVFEVQKDPTTNISSIIAQ